MERPSNIPNPVFKSDVVMALADAIIRIGKNDPFECRKYIRRAETLLNFWLEDRPEKRSVEADRKGEQHGNKS